MAMMVMMVMQVATGGLVGAGTIKEKDAGKVYTHGRRPRC